MEWVQPNSTGSNKNMSWYLARSQQAVSTSSGAQESRPIKSNLSNNLPCLCLTVSLGVWGSWDSSDHPAIALCQGVWAEAMQLLPWSLGISSGGSVLFLTTTTAFLLPCLNSVYVFCTVRPCGKEPSSVHKACTGMSMRSPIKALPAFTGTMQEEKGSMVSAFWV